MPTTVSLLNKTRFSHLNLVVTIAEVKTLHRAAEALNMSQPAITRAIKELENQLGTSLFFRSHQGVTLTPSGKQFARHAQIMLNQMQSAVQNIEEIKSGIYGQVNMAILPSTAAELLPRSIQRLDEMGSKISINVIGGPSRQLVPMLLKGDLDMIVGRLPKHVDDLEQIPLMYDPFSIICAPDHPLARKKSISLESLNDEQWIYPVSNSSLLMKDVKAMYLQMGVPMPKNVITIYSIQAIRKLLLLTPRIALHSYQVARDEEKFGSIKILPVEMNARLTPVGITTRPENEQSPAVRVLKQVIEEISLEMKDEQPLYLHA